MKMDGKRRILFTIRGVVVGAFLFFNISLLAQDISFTASVDKSTVGVDEQFTLTLTLNSASMSGGRNYKAPDLRGFLVLSGPNQSTSMQIINASVSSTVTYSYALQPRQAGIFSIGAASIEVGGKQYRTQPLTVTVVKGAPKPKQPAAKQDESFQTGDNIFLRAVVDQSRVFQGEQVTATFKVYTRLRIANYSINKLPSLTGFWGEDLPVPQQVALSNEVINGKQYQVGVLKKMALFPTQNGTLEISPLEIICQVQMQSRRQSNDPFDIFFNDPFFSSVQTTNLGVKSPPVRIAVLPLPKHNVPESFKGAVGRFGMNVGLSRHDVKTNEPVSLKATISGSGNIKILEAPNLEVPSDFEKYDPKVTESIDRSASAVNGSKTFEWLLVPRYPGEKKILPLEFSYYDPSRGTYVTLRSGQLVLNVEKGSAEAPQISAGISKEDVRLLNQDIRFIKSKSASFRKRGEELLPTGTAVVITLVPLLAFVGLAAYRQKVAKDRADVVSFRSRRAMKVATRRLREARALLTSDNAEAFYAEVSRALWQYVSDKLALDRAELSIDNVTLKLNEKSISSELVEKIKVCLESCEFARYAPSSSSQMEKNKMFEAASDIIINAERGLRS